MVVSPTGKFNIDQIIVANSVFTNMCDRKEMVELWPKLKDQMVVDFVPPDVQPKDAYPRFR